MRSERMATYHWTQKAHGQIKTLMRQFSMQDIKKMVDWWMKKKGVPDAANFSKFFVERWGVFQQIRDKDYEWQ